MDHKNENHVSSEDENDETGSVNENIDKQNMDYLDDDADVNTDDMDQDNVELSTQQLQEIIATLQDQIDDIQDKNLRIISEMENLRKRTQREVADSSKYAISQFAKDFLGIYDNLTRALDAAESEAGEQVTDVTKNLIDGVTITQKELIKALDKNNTKKIEIIIGESLLDPNLHQPMFVNEDKSVPNNTICQILQDGFMIGERVLRPSLVGVAKGGPKAVKVEVVQDESEQTDNAGIKAKLDNVLKKKPTSGDEHKLDKKA